MKTTVKYSKVNYTEFEKEDGLKGIYCDLVAEIQPYNIRDGWRLMASDSVYPVIKRRVNKDGNIVIHTRGKAVCLPTDTFDYEVGRRLAYTRAQRAAFNMAAQIYSEMFVRFAEDFHNVIENCISSAVGCDFHTYEIMYGDEAESKFSEDRLCIPCDCICDDCDCDDCDSNDCDCVKTDN